MSIVVQKLFCTCISSLRVQNVTRNWPPAFSIDVKLLEAITVTAVTYQYVAILQYDVVQYNSIHLLQHINLLCRAIYCSVLCVLCEPELDHWNVNVDKLLLCMKT